MLSPSFKASVFSKKIKKEPATALQPTTSRRKGSELSRSPFTDISSFHLQDLQSPKSAALGHSFQKQCQKSLAIDNSGQEPPKSAVLGPRQSTADSNGILREPHMIMRNRLLKCSLVNRDVREISKLFSRRPAANSKQTMLKIDSIVGRLHQPKTIDFNSQMSELKQLSSAQEIAVYKLAKEIKSEAQEPALTLEDSQDYHQFIQKGTSQEQPVLEELRKMSMRQENTVGRLVQSQRKPSGGLKPAFEDLTNTINSPLCIKQRGHLEQNGHFEHLLEQSGNLDQLEQHLSQLEQRGHPMAHLNPMGTRDHGHLVTQHLNTMGSRENVAPLGDLDCMESLHGKNEGFNNEFIENFDFRLNFSPFREPLDKENMIQGMPFSPFHRSACIEENLRTPTPCNTPLKRLLSSSKVQDMTDLSPKRELIVDFDELMREFAGDWKCEEKEEIFE